MAEEAGEKTEAPTPRRRQEAREQGNVAKSPDLTAAVLLIGAMVLLHSCGGTLVAALKGLLTQMLGPSSLGDLRLTAPLQLLIQIAVVGGIGLAPILGGIFLLAILGNVLQVGFNFSGKKLEPNLGALNPIRGFGRLFGQVNSLVTLAMNMLKMFLVGIVAYSAVHGRLQQILAVQQLSYMQIFALGMDVIYAIALRIGILLFVLAIIDYMYQRFRIEKDLRMSKQDVKEEMRRMDGDPLIKHRRRQIAMQIAKQRLKQDVPKADVIVTNPTEFAVAIQYDPKMMNAPRVIAKGQGYMALRIREIAIESGVPILERKPLARALFRLVQVGQEIPEQFYAAVAEILAYVYELSGKLKEKQFV